MATITPRPLRPASLARVAGGNGQTIIGTEYRDSVDGGDGNDSILGLDGRDNLWAGAGNDVVEGGNGADWLFGQFGDDTLRGGADNDNIYTGTSGPNGDLALGGEGDDTINASGVDDTVIGGTGADVLRSYEGNVTFVWKPGEGNDTIQGHIGFDTMRLEGTGLSTFQLLYQIEVAEGSPKPVWVNGVINLTGVTGSIVIGGERIQFSGLDRLVVGDVTQVEGR
jgi:Ca2+-binding RTX toxin-like protein